MAKDQSIAIQRNTRTPDGGGGFTWAWATIVTIWAEVRGLTAKETLQEGRMNASSTNVFWIWKDDCPTLTELDRILWNGETWNIRSVPRLGERVLEWKIEAERGVAS